MSIWNLVFHEKIENRLDHCFSYNDIEVQFEKEILQNHYLIPRWHNMTNCDQYLKGLGENLVSNIGPKRKNISQIKYLNYFIHSCANEGVRLQRSTAEIERDFNIKKQHTWVTNHGRHIWCHIGMLVIPRWNLFHKTFKGEVSSIRNV